MPPLSRIVLSVLIVGAFFTGALAAKFIHPFAFLLPEPAPRQSLEAVFQANRTAGLKDYVAVFGDSQIASLSTAHLQFPVENFGIGGETIDDLTRRIPLYNLTEARAVVINIGLNNWVTDKLQGYAAKMERLMKNIPTGVPITILAINPLAETSSIFGDPSLANTAIIKANNDAARICQRLQGCTFLRPNLADERGFLRPEFHDVDGVHLSQAGFAVWRRSLSGAPSMTHQMTAAK